MSVRSLWCAAVIVTAFAGAFAQSPDAEVERAKKERRARLIERLSGDVEQLRLPENRALVNVRLGNAVWGDDKETARKYFEAAIAELISAQQFAETVRTQRHAFYDLLQSQNLRPQILNTIAGADAEFALEQLHRSRPAMVARAIAGASANDKKIGSPAGELEQIAQNESNLEQRITRMIADQKPEKAAAILRESIKKRLSTETLASLQKLFAKDPASANSLANDVLDRLAREKFINEQHARYELVGLSNSILYEFVRQGGEDERRLAFDESRIRTLAGKVIGLYLSEPQRMGYIPLEQLEPVARRFDPPAFEQLKKAAQGMRGRHHMIVEDPELKKLLESNPAPETMVTAAKNMPAESRRSLYYSAANKFAEKGQYQTAVAMLNEQFEGDTLDNAIGSLNWYYAHHLIQKGQFDAAEAMIMEFGESNRISALTSLAQSVFNADREKNKPRAAGILNRARETLPARPENQNDMNQTFAIVTAMTSIDGGEAFRMYEPLVDQLNELAQAWAVVQAYQGGNLRQGEYLLTHGFNFGVHIDPNLFRTLAQHDYERSEKLIDMFSRTEIRIMLKLYLAEGGLI